MEENYTNKTKRIIEKNWNQVKHLFTGDLFKTKKEKYIKALSNGYKHIDALLYAYSNKEIKFDEKIIKNKHKKLFYSLTSIFSCLNFMMIFLFCITKKIEIEHIGFFNFIHRNILWISPISIILFIVFFVKSIKIYKMESNDFDYSNVITFFVISLALSVILITLLTLPFNPYIRNYIHEDQNSYQVKNINEGGYDIIQKNEIKNFSKYVKGEYFYIKFKKKNGEEIIFKYKI